MGLNLLLLSWAGMYLSETGGYVKFDFREILYLMCNLTVRIITMKVNIGWTAGNFFYVKSNSGRRKTLLYSSSCASFARLKCSNSLWKAGLTTCRWVQGIGMSAASRLSLSFCIHIATRRFHLYIGQASSPITFLYLMFARSISWLIDWSSLWWMSGGSFLW